MLNLYDLIIVSIREKLDYRLRERQLVLRCLLAEHFLTSLL